MKSLFAAVLTAGLLCMASSASAFELLSNLGFGGGYGCGCEPVQKGCGPVQKDCGPVQKDCCHRDRCHRDRCHRSWFDRCNRGCCEKVPSCSSPVQACGMEKGPVQKGGDCCHRDRCHRDRCGGCFSGLFANWGGCGCRKSCGCEPACGYDKGPIQK
jgi:hypothetical protein